MSNLLWFIMIVLALIPGGICIIYFFRRLGTRRDLLKETLTSLQLEETYMTARHADVPAGERKQKFAQTFKQDFRAGLGLWDYLWPVALVTVLGFVGWFLALSRAYPISTLLVPVSIFPNAFAFGFAGAFFASLLAIFEDFRMFTVKPSSYYSITYRLLFSSTAAYLVSAANIFTEGLTPLVAFGIGLFPIETTWRVITDKTAQAVGTAVNEGEVGAALAKIQGLEDRPNRQKLIDVDISTVQALATADPFWLFLQTTFGLRSLVDMMDKAILYLYLGDKLDELRKHGVNGVIELRALVPLAGNIAAFGNQVRTKAVSDFFKTVDTGKLMESLAEVLGQKPDEMKAFIYNLYDDPQVRLLYDIWGRYLDAEETDGASPAPVQPMAAAAAAASQSTAAASAVSPQPPPAAEG